MISVTYEELKGDKNEIMPRLIDAFGENALGVLIVTGLPEQYASMRTSALTYSARLASLPSSELAKLERPDENYLTGWSRGREMFNGQPDTQKGSFYYNPTYGENVWPDIDGFKESVLTLGQFMVDVGMLVASACDAYAGSSLEPMIRDSQTCKARLLHYYPTDTDVWCGEHFDHGCLTALTSAMYGDDVDCEAGLYIKSRTGETVRIDIPRDALAFQTGSALELATNGAFKAVPHFVRGSPGVSRSTLAVFMQPNLDQRLGRDEIMFKDFARRVVDANTLRPN